MLAADSVHGLAPPVDVFTDSAINPDLTVVLHALPKGEWVGFDAASYASRLGAGSAHARVFDETSAVGAAVLSLVIRSMP